MTARLAIAGGLGVWLASVVYGVLLLGGPLPFMEGGTLLLIVLYFGLLVLSLVLFSIGICCHPGYSTIGVVPRLVLYLAFALAIGTICRFSAPYILQIVIQGLMCLGRFTLPVVNTLHQMRWVPLWSLIWSSAGLPLGVWATCTWLRCTRPTGVSPQQ